MTCKSLSLSFFNSSLSSSASQWVPEQASQNCVVSFLALSSCCNSASMQRSSLSISDTSLRMLFKKKSNSSLSIAVITTCLNIHFALLAINICWKSVLSSSYCIKGVSLYLKLYPTGKMRWQSTFLGQVGRGKGKICMLSKSLSHCFKSHLGIR